ncbi:hypothetical protein GE253_22935 [Niveispirillum sp. SYP-B3756]|uniref:hypothetical protein n=1 Tax=Niveispirillum sp. SYP-B3756 TaxID=2662178 RepID=UPI0012923E22|nr:hypothetical protein [Niveispirillum sp. SYP-B3756]MQP68178.1 hypothetical protein [Niveispirillum sp. SYP-B3756]
MMKKTLALSMALSLLLSQAATAQMAADGCDDATMQKYETVAIQAADREYKNVILPVIRRPANIMQLSCLERFVNPRGVDILFDVSGLMSSLVNDLLGKACAAADQVWSQVPSLNGSVYANQVPLPPGTAVNSTGSTSSVKIYMPTGSSGGQQGKSGSILDNLFGGK